MATTTQNNVQTSSALTQATVGWLELLKTARKMEKKYKKKMEDLRRQMTRNYRLVTTEIEKENNDEERAKKWIHENLEEAQLFIDNIVGIKGITEDPLKVAAELERCESNVIAANTNATLQAQFHDHANDDEFAPQPPTPTQHLPRVSISSSIVPSNEELYGY